MGRPGIASRGTGPNFCHGLLVKVSQTESQIREEDMNLSLHRRAQGILYLSLEMIFYINLKEYLGHIF